jgi:hypothetical protein
MPKSDSLRLPVVSHGAEFLVQGYLMRRNILTYKAPPNNEGYDLICIHPDPRKVTRQIRIQVKSRYASDITLRFPVKLATITAFDFLIAAFLNIGNYYRRGECAAGYRPPEFYTFPASFVRRHHNARSSWEKMSFGNLNVERFKNERGFELIAKALKIAYPTRPINP